MAASGVAVGFERTPFAHGFVFREYLGPAHHPPSNEVGQREWLEGFLQAHADYPDEPYDPDNPENGVGNTYGRAGCLRSIEATVDALKIVGKLLNS